MRIHIVLCYCNDLLAKNNVKGLCYMQFLFSCIDLVKNSVSLYTHEFFLFLNSSFSSSVFRFHYLQYPFSSLLNTAPFFVMLFMPLMYLSSVSDIPDLGLGMYSWSNSVESQRAFFFILGFYSSVTIWFCRPCSIF